MSEDKRGIGDNSKITEAKIFTDWLSNDTENYQTLNPVDNELIKQVKAQLKKIQSIISKCVDKHAASHGAEYHFAAEVSNEKDIRNGCDPEFGVWRIPTKYEKNKFGVETEQELNKANNDLQKIIWSDLKDVEDKDDK